MAYFNYDCMTGVVVVVVGEITQLWLYTRYVSRYKRLLNNKLFND